MIIEKQLGIKGDYQYQAINSKNYLQKNWHLNKFNLLDEIFKNEKNISSKTVLDLGTGSGNFELIFYKKFKYIIGVDYNDEALEFLKSKLESQKIDNVELITKDIKYIEEIGKECLFDYIVLIDIIEHLRNEDGKNLVSKLHKLLNKNGRVIVITPNYKSMWIYIEKILDLLPLLPKFEGEQHLTKYDISSLNNLFSPYFKNYFCTTFNTFSYLFPVSKLNKLVSLVEYNYQSKYGNLLLSIYEK
jgi:2-polyprenyl-3-methyl-5-hydroxy-6-metoxy-1,4-benzoquinol methylase